MGILLNIPGRINELTTWGMALITGLLILRAANDLMKVFSDGDGQVTLKEALTKIRKRIYAVVIALTVDGTILWISKFYR